MPSNRNRIEAWKHITDALSAIEPQVKVSGPVQLWHRTYGYQPTEGITTATVKHAALYGSVMQLDVVFPLLPSKPWGVFELPASSVRDMYTNRQIKFRDPAELNGARVHLHTGSQFQHDGYPRSIVIGIKVLTATSPN